MSVQEFIIPVLFVAVLSAGWVIVQILAKKMKTKNHFDDLGQGGCMNCTCGGIEKSDECEITETK